MRLLRFVEQDGPETLDEMFTKVRLNSTQTSWSFWINGNGPMSVPGYWSPCESDLLWIQWNLGIWRSAKGLKLGVIARYFSICLTITGETKSSVTPRTSERVISIGIILLYFRLCRGYRLPTAQKRRIKRYIM